MRRPECTDTSPPAKPAYRRHATSAKLSHTWVLVLAVIALHVHAESETVSERNNPGVLNARINFKIVIPTVLMVDTKSGTVYTNDAKSAIRFGSERTSPTPMLGDHARPVQAGLMPVSAANGGWRFEQAGGRFVGRMAQGSSAGGDIICMP